MYLAAGTAPGRFLLAAARAQLGGRALPATRQSVLTFDMHQVCHMAADAISDLPGHQMKMFDLGGCVRQAVQFDKLQEGS